MPENKKINLGAIAAAVTILLGLFGIYTAYNLHVAKSVLEQAQDDSSYARSTRAVAWIDQNSWRVLHRKDSTLR